MPDTERIRFEDLVTAIDSTLQRAGAAPEAAAIMARNFAGCERDGAHSHGVFRVPQIVETLATGYLDGAAQPTVEQVTDSYLRVDAHSGFAQVALEAARPAILQALEQQGVAIAAIRNSHHHSALWPDIEPFAEAGYAAITAVAAGVPNTAPAGATEPVYGTNPFAYAAPNAGSHPLVVDFATSAISFGDVTLAAQEGKALPAGTGLDEDGHETTDAAAIVDGGTLLPFGGHKGASLSLMVELLAAALTGGDFSVEAAEGKPEGAVTTRTGQFVLAIDPNRGATGDFAERAQQLIAVLRGAGLERLPGDRRYAARDEAASRGIPVTPAIRDLLGS